MDAMNKIYIFDEWNKIVQSYQNTNHRIANDVYDNLIHIYSNSDRHHHNVKHIEHVITKLLDLFNVYKFKQYDIDICIIAAFFHDIEYNTKKPSDIDTISDEELSSIYAGIELKKIGFDESFISDVSNLILLTSNHKANEHINIDILLQNIFADADMAILGEDSFLYTQYSDAIKSEYNEINPEAFILGRKNFLIKLSKLKTIFLTDYMNELYNDQAHFNIETEIKELNRLYVELLTKTEV